jgi:LmbE family N-acetylglucosaminyl deacetylase
MAQPFGTTLAIGAHPDDIFFNAAGLLARNQRLGHPVISVNATTGQAASGSFDRCQEETDAFALLGIADVRFLGFEDGQLHNVPFQDGVDAVRELLYLTQPDTVVTFGPDGLTGHSDHIEISHWVTEAFNREAPASSQLLYIAATSGWAEQVIPVLDLADAVYKRPLVVADADLAFDYRLTNEELTLKLQGIGLHRSQIPQLAKAVGGLDRLLPWFARESLVQAAAIPSFVP